MDDALCFESWSGKNTGRRSVSFSGKEIHRGVLIPSDFQRKKPCRETPIYQNKRRRTLHEESLAKGSLQVADPGQKEHPCLWYSIMVFKKKVLHSVIYQMKSIHLVKKQGRTTDETY